jgi:hypothetical protein
MLACKLSKVHIMAKCDDGRLAIAYKVHKLITTMFSFMVAGSNTYCESLHTIRNFAIWYLNLIILIVYACLHVLSCIPEESRRYNPPDQFHFAYLNILVSVFLFGVVVYVYIDGIDCQKDMGDGLTYLGVLFAALHTVVAAWFVKLNRVFALKQKGYTNPHIELATSKSSNIDEPSVTNDNKPAVVSEMILQETYDLIYTDELTSVFPESDK